MPAVQTTQQAPSPQQAIGVLQPRFRVVPAFSDVLKDEAFRIRHQVFCEELTLFPRTPDRREIDAFDERAVQLLLKHVASDEFIGCVRVVKGRPNDPLALLPFESVCRERVDKTLLNLETLPRNLVGEVSRLGVVAKFRRRKGEDKSPVPLASDAGVGDADATENRRQFPHILVSLYLGAYAIAQREGIEHLFTFTELRLFNHLIKLGLPVKVIGPSIEHKGLRVPAVMDVPGIASTFNPSIQAIYTLIARDIDAHLEQPL